MAVYTFSNGVFKKDADTLEELLPAHLVDWDVLEELLSGLGFSKFDQIDGVYTSWVREGDEIDAQWLPALKWIIDVETYASSFDLVFIEDNLPDYLGAMATFQPLIQRSKDILIDIEKEQLLRARGELYGRGN